MGMGTATPVLPERALDPLAPLEAEKVAQAPAVDAVRDRRNRPGLEAERGALVPVVVEVVMAKDPPAQVAIAETEMATVTVKAPDLLVPLAPAKVRVPHSRPVRHGRRQRVKARTKDNSLPPRVRVRVRVSNRLPKAKAKTSNHPPQAKTKAKDPPNLPAPPILLRGVPNPPAASPPRPIPVRICFPACARGAR